MWSAYRDNLRYVLEGGGLLLNNLDADRVAISADHGNGVGEYGIYGHPNDLLLPAIRRVPWVETTAQDTGGHKPRIEHEAADSEEEVSDRLRALGYADQ